MRPVPGRFKRCSAGLAIRQKNLQSPCRCNKMYFNALTLHPTGHPSVKVSINKNQQVTAAWLSWYSPGSLFLTWSYSRSPGYSRAPQARKELAKWAGNNFSSGTLPQFLASIKFRAICCSHFLKNEDAVKKILFANIRNTITCQKLWQGLPLGKDRNSDL